MAASVYGKLIARAVLRPKVIYTSAYDATSRRHIWGWLNSVFNRVDESRIKEVGPDRACAEWCLRCGALVKWKDFENWTVDYNLLPAGNFERYKIEEIDGTDSAVMNIGFPHLRGLKHLKKIKFHKASYLDDGALEQLRYVKDTLESLQVTSCGNVSEEGVRTLVQLTKLKELYLFDLPEVRDKVGCRTFLKKALPNCEIDFPTLKEMEERKQGLEEESNEDRKKKSKK